MFTRSSAAALFVSALCLFAGCALVDSREGGYSVEFTTDSDIYEPVIAPSLPATIRFLIATAMENDGDEDVVLIGCINPSLPVLQKLVDGVWTTVYAVAEPECLSPPWFVEPGEIHRDTLRVDAVLDPDVVPTPRWDNGITLDGTYRLERMIYTDHRTSEFGDPLPLTERVTPTFEIRARHSSTLP